MEAGKGEGNGLDLLISVAAVVPGLDALKGLKGGAKLLDHADEAADAMKVVGDALKGLPPGATDNLLKNPELLEQFTKNPELFQQALQYPNMSTCVVEILDKPIYRYIIRAHICSA